MAKLFRPAGPALRLRVNDALGCRDPVPRSGHASLGTSHAPESVMGNDGLHVVFGTGQVGRAPAGCRHRSYPRDRVRRRGHELPGPVRQRPGGRRAASRRRRPGRRRCAGSGHCRIHPQNLPKRRLDPPGRPPAARAASARQHHHHPARRPCAVLPFPTGDLEAAFRATSAPDITAYSARARRPARLSRSRTPYLPVIRVGTSHRPRRRRPGLAAGPRACYAFTAAASIRAVDETLARSLRGALSPAGAFGPGFILTIPGTTRTDAIPAETAA